MGRVAQGSDGGRVYWLQEGGSFNGSGGDRILAHFLDQILQTGPHRSVPTILQAQVQVEPSALWRLILGKGTNVPLRLRL